MTCASCSDEGVWKGSRRKATMKYTVYPKLYRAIVTRGIVPGRWFCCLLFSYTHKRGTELPWSV